MKKFLLTLVLLLLPASAQAQSGAILVPEPVPVFVDGCVLVYDGSAGRLVCGTVSSIIQPLISSSPLMKDGTDSTKLLSFNLTGISPSTTRTITWPDANITFPTTIASLGANTFTGLQTLSAGATVTGTVTATTFSGSGASLTGIVNANIDAAAAIAYSKLALTGAVVNADIGAAAAIDWTKISKTGSSLADLATRSAADLSSGTLPDGRFPATLPAVSGANLTSLDATDLTGTVDPARIAGSYTGITGVGTLTAGTWNATAIGPTFGGTGQTTYATGDILYASAANTLSKLAAGNNGEFLVLSGGVPTWTASSVAGHDILSATHTDTTVGTVARGDLMTGQGGTSTWARLAKGAAGTALMSDGTDLSWGTQFSEALSGSKVLGVRNTTNSTGASAYLQVGNDLSQSFGVLRAFSSTYADATIASSVRLSSEGVNGLTLLALDAAGSIRFQTGGFTNRMVLSPEGRLAVNGFGMHAFSAGGTGGNIIKLENTTVGATNYASLRVFNNEGSGAYLNSFSSTYTTGTYDVQSGVGFAADGSGGMSIAAIHASGVIRFYSGGTTERMKLTAGGSLILKPTAGLFFDDGGDTYIHESAANQFDFVAGNQTALRLTATTFSSANIYSNTSASAANVFVDSNGVVYRSTSARKYKQDIEPFTDGLDALLRLTPVTYSPLGNAGARHVGFVADDSVEATPLLVSYGDNGEVEGYQYERLTPYIVNALRDVRGGWQQHDARIAALEAQVKTLTRKQ